MQNSGTTRRFEDRPAVRERVPLWLGLFGASGSGKTFSALRLATGIQKVTGGDIFVIDTEARRALAYADRFTFRHVELGAPFSPLDYLAAVEHCVSKGARVIVVDSMSHEHEGPGGVLEWQAAEEERLAKAWNTSRDKAKMSAWQVPKAARRRMINTFLQMSTNFVFCFRAKEKMKVIPGRNPEPQGFMPIAGEEFVYEMTATALLLPGAYGVPTWQSQETGEAAMIKRPEQFRALIAEHAKAPLSEAMGEAMGQWAAGDAEHPEVTRLAALIDAAPDDAAVDAAGKEAAALVRGRTLTKADLDKLSTRARARRAVLRGEVPAPPSTVPPARPTPPAAGPPAERQMGEEG